VQGRPKAKLDQLLPIGHLTGYVLLTAVQVHTTIHCRSTREQHWAPHLLVPALYVWPNFHGVFRDFHGVAFRDRCCLNFMDLFRYVFSNANLLCTILGFMKADMKFVSTNRLYIEDCNLYIIDG